MINFHSGIKAINRIFTGDSDVDRQSGGETFAFLFLFGALAAVAAVAVTTDIFDDFPILGDILGKLTNCSLNFIVH